jgi:hypothetical protein
MMSNDALMTQSLPVHFAITTAASKSTIYRDLQCRGAGPMFRQELRANKGCQLY